MNILFCWELGAGYGHLQPMRALAAAIRRRGGSVSALVPEARYADALAADLSTPSSVIPEFLAPQDLRSRPDAWPEMLLGLGFGDPQQMGPRIDWFLAEIERRSPDALVCEHAPTALLAARIARVPVMAIGTGWTLPPAFEPMPAYRPTLQIEEAELRRRETPLVDAVNPLLSERGGAPLEAAADWLDVDCAILKTWPELDHYGARESANYVGPIWHRHPGPAPEWPEGEGQRVFCYLKGHWRGLHSLISGFAHLPVRVLVHIDREREQSYVAPSNVRVSAEPLDVEQVLEQADFIVSHGGHTLTCQALLAGLPQWLLPLHAEQEVTAWRLHRLGCGHLYTGSLGSARMARVMRRVLADEAPRQAARRWAADFGDWRLDAAIETVVDRLAAVARE
ncbi:MAG: hypothetical protein U5L08_11255 [Xanthomonadales bacterium]|nr:hypothetical protein [Xanthomonadales bacterium]